MDRARIMFITFFCLLLNAIVPSFSSESDLCDVKMWYLDMLGEGALHGDLNEKQQRVKTSVEKLIHSQKGSVKLECKTVALYEQILTDNEDDDENKEQPEANEKVVGEESNLVQDSGGHDAETETRDETESDEDENEIPPSDETEEVELQNGDSKEDHVEEEDVDAVANNAEDVSSDDPTENDDQNTKEVLDINDNMDTEENGEVKESEDDIADEHDKIDETENDDASAEDEHQNNGEDDATRNEKLANKAENEPERNNEIFNEDNIERLHDKMANKQSFIPIGVCLKDNISGIFEALFVHPTMLSLTDKTEEYILTDNVASNVTESLGETFARADRKSADDVKFKPSLEVTEPVGHVSNKTKLDVKEIEELLNRKKVEYAHKIQEIELQLLKLENRLLMETLSKQNNTASYTRLENLILKLENELLKINRSFVMIQEENNQLKAKQLSEKQIYDIFNKAKEEDKEAEEKYLALADNSTALGSMVDKQQNKIIELVLMMHNQTDFINKLEEKSQRLEEQNRQLHDVLVNQSNMMLELVKGMKYMKEEQEKLKTTVAQPLPLTTQNSQTISDKEDVSANTNPPNVRDNEEHAVPDGESSKSISDDEAKLEEKKETRNVDPNSEKARETENLSGEKDDIDKIKTIKTDPVKPDDKTNYINIANKKPNEKVPQDEIKIPSPTKKSQPSAKKPPPKVVIPDTPKYFNPKSSGPKDCHDHFTSGKRKRDMAMRVKVGPDDRDLQVFCDMKNGGWTVIMRRSDGSIDFFKDWNQYKNGFGGVLGEHWIGNDVIHLLTNQKNYRLRIEMTDWERNTAWAEYDYFMIDDENNSYKLYVTGFNNDSTAGDGLLKHSGMKFSTKDVDNDLAVKDFNGSCSKRFSGAWWYYKCYKSNLTGKYYRDGLIAEGMYDGISWKAWKPSTVSLKKVEMKIIPRG